MTRYYNMAVMINGIDPARSDEIARAANQEWDFGFWDTRGDFMMGSADDHLCGGESEEQFAERLAKVIWRANGGPCRIEVAATYLEELPREEYTFGEEDYARLMAPQEKAPEG